VVNENMKNIEIVSYSNTIKFESIMINFEYNQISKTKSLNICKQLLGKEKGITKTGH
jgi:hypothetical protein